MHGVGRPKALAETPTTGAPTGAVDDEADGWVNIKESEVQPHLTYGPKEQEVNPDGALFGASDHKDPLAPDKWYTLRKNGTGIDDLRKTLKGWFPDGKLPNDYISNILRWIENPEVTDNRTIPERFRNSVLDVVKRVVYPKTGDDEIRESLIRNLKLLDSEVTKNSMHVVGPSLTALRDEVNKNRGR